MASGSACDGIVPYLEKKTILITGGSGFLAKVLLEKILRIQPNIANIYILIRASDSKSLMRRFENEVISKELFKILRGKYGANFDSFISKKVVPVAGDVSCGNLGLQDPITIEQMLNKLDFIVNVAATTNFYERYDVAMGTNTWGALHVLNFAKKCVQLKLMIHVSTAYVCGEKEGIIQEVPLSMGETLLKDGKSYLDVLAEHKLIEDKLNELRSKHYTEEAITSTMKELGIIRAEAHGWPNTYVFTKAMGEMVLGKFKNDVPLIIIRPTIVTCTFRQPFPGWIEGLRTIDVVVAGIAKGRIKFLPYDPNTVVDAIPADMVINSILVVLVVHVDRSSSGTIYHIGSSSKNPVTYEDLYEYTIQYFTKHCLVDRNGNSIKVERIIAFDTMAKFHKHMIRYTIPLQGLRLINIVTCKLFKDLYETSKRKIQGMIRFANLYKPYIFFKGIFDDTNSENLRMEAKTGMEDKEFNFDPRTIDWENYILNTHLPGLVDHVISKRSN